MSVLVEGFDCDAIALAGFLAREGNTVRLAGGGEVPDDPASLEACGILLEPDRDLDRDPGPAEVAYLDVWTPEVAPRVLRLRAQGTHISCLADLLLERWPGPTIGITGTAGKTTTTSLVASILRVGGTDLVIGTGARAGNLWPTGELLGLLPGTEPTERTLLVELTSSHLAFTNRSPTVAAIVSFWPDHLELHGDLERYRAAKATIAQHQSVDEALVLNADDAAASFSAEARGHLLEFSLRQPVRRGAYRRSASELVLVGPSGSEVSVRAPFDAAAHPGNVVAAAAIAEALGASASDVASGIAGATSLPFRARQIGTLRGALVVDDGMAATPAKSQALLATYADNSIVLIAGGSDDAGGGPVHATSEEAQRLASACDEIARVARSAILFGVAGARLGTLLRERDVDVLEAKDLAAAVAAATGRAAGAVAIVFSPLFPVSMEDRVGFSSLIARSAR